MTPSITLGLALSLVSSLAFAQSHPLTSDGRRWLAGDHHVHSRFSARYTPDPSALETAPFPELGGDGNHTIIQNAEAGLRFGLSWMVSTDHGGPLHARLNAEQAYPELLAARGWVPDVVLFYGMEFDTPGAEHSSLIIPQSAHERDNLLYLEGRYGRREPWPADPSRDTEVFMLEALRDMATMSPRPVMVTNHPSRSATGLGDYGDVRPHQLRDWSEITPRVVIGMEGAPGHQADGLFADGSADPTGSRGIYRRFPTMGGFDQMTARLGGVWDSLLGEGRRWWITATSDSHTNISEGGDDFWPGEYAKTFVMARPDAEDILDGLREGRVFVATGGLISELDVVASVGDRRSEVGDALTVTDDEEVLISIRVRDPGGANASGRKPSMSRIDLIVGEISDATSDRDADINPTTRIEQSFTPTQWSSSGEVITLTYRLPASDRSRYVRIRGTNGAELEPQVDAPGEDPWSDLWFYSNPIFLEQGRAAR